MRLIFPQETVVADEFNIEALTSLIYKKKFRFIKNYIKKIEIMYLINDETLPIKSGKELKEFYVIKINLARPGLPLEFLKRLDSYIDFPVLYWLRYKNCGNYVLPIIKKEKGKKLKPQRVIYTGWIEDKKVDDVIYDGYSDEHKTVDDVYHGIIEFISGVRISRESRVSINQYVEEIKKAIKNASLYERIDRPDVHILRLHGVNAGSPTFDSMKEYFTYYSDQKWSSPIFKIDKVMRKYMTNVGCESCSFSYAGDVKVNESLFAAMLYVDNIKVNTGADNYLYKEINAKFKGESLDISDCRQRSEDEVKEMKLIYGKYLIESGNSAATLNTEESDESVGLTRTQRTKQPQRRKMTPEERKLYLGEQSV